MKQQLFVKSVITALIISISGCASIIDGSSRPVTIKSTPDGAHFVVKNANGTEVHSGTTPSTVTLGSKAGYFQKMQYTVVFSKEGYADQNIPLTPSLNGWYFGNILLGGLIGMLIVDPLTGAMWKLPDDAAGTLTAQAGTVKLEDGIAPQLQIVTRDQIPAELQDRLIQVR